MTDPRIGGDPEPEQDDVIGTAADDYDIDGEFDLDRYQEETAGDPYPFRWAGQRWMLPNVYDLPTSILDLVGKDDLNSEHVQAALEAAFGKDQWTAINAAKPVPIRATFALFGRWLKHSGVDVGELLSSVVSSNGTAGPSKRTSRSSTKSGSTGRSTAGRKTATRRVNSSR